MRILMLNNEFPPKGGGMGTVNQALLAHFSRLADLEIDLITSALEQHYEEFSFSERIRIYRVPVGNKNIHHASNQELLTYVFRATRLAQRLQKRNSYDLCFAWSGVPAGGVALLLKRLFRLRYFVRVSGPDIPGFEKRYQWLYPILTPIVRSIWKEAEIVITKCDEESNLIRSIDRQPNLMIIPNGVDVQQFRPSDADHNKGIMRILCVARLIERKGQRQLIEAVKRLTDKGIEVNLQLAGTGDAKRDYEKLSRDLGIADRVRFLGYVPREEIAVHYAAADVFVLPSFNEGMSMATLEAMASGLPVLVTKTGGTNELVDEEINGLTFDWGDIDRLTTHLHRLADDRSITKTMGRASRRKAEKLSWEAIVESYLKLFDMILRKPTSAVSLDNLDL